MTAARAVGGGLVLIATFGLGSCTPAPTPEANAPVTSPTTASTPTTATAPVVTATPHATGPLPDAMKGYELYSWSVDGEWHFTLATGTNRSKTAEEIKTRPTGTGDFGMVDVRGVDGLATLLARLPAAQGILWAGRGGGGPNHDFDLPPTAVVDAVRQRCQQLGLTLLVPS